MARTANFLATFPNWIDATYVNPAAGFRGVAFSGGGWEPGTLDYLRDEQLATRAVSVGLSPGETRFDVDFGAIREFKSLAIPDGNATRDARVRARIFGPTLATEYDTGWTDWWNVVYPLGTLPSTHPSFVDGKLTEEDRASGYKMPWLSILPSPVLGMYGTLEFEDTANPDGFLALPRLFIAGGWQSSINLKYGRGLSYEFNTQALESLGGAKFYEERDPRRVVACEFLLPQSEAYAFPLQMQRSLQNSRQLFVSIDPANQALLHENSFLATIRQASPLEAAFYEFENTGFVFEEVIG